MLGDTLTPSLADSHMNTYPIITTTGRDGYAIQSSAFVPMPVLSRLEGSTVVGVFSYMSTNIML